MAMLLSVNKAALFEMLKKGGWHEIADIRRPFRHQKTVDAKYKCVNKKTGKRRIKYKKLGRFRYITISLKEDQHKYKKVKKIFAVPNSANKKVRHLRELQESGICPINLRDIYDMCSSKARPGGPLQCEPVLEPTLVSTTNTENDFFDLHFFDILSYYSLAFIFLYYIISFIYRY